MRKFLVWIASFFRPRYEVQTVEIRGKPTGGSFTITYQGETTDSIAYNASAEEIQLRLEGLFHERP